MADGLRIADEHGAERAPAPVRLHSFVTLCPDGDEARCTARVVSIHDEEITLECGDDQRLPDAARAGDCVTLVPLDGNAASVRARVEWASDTDALVALVDAPAARPSVRRGLRVAMDEPAEITLFARDGSVRRRVRARLVDVSTNGCALAVAAELTPGAVLRIAVRLAGRNVEMRGTVVRLQPLDGLLTRVAVRLDGIDETAKRTISACVRTRTIRAFGTTP